MESTSLPSSENEPAASWLSPSLPLSLPATPSTQQTDSEQPRTPLTWTSSLAQQMPGLTPATTTFVSCLVTQSIPTTAFQHSLTTTALEPNRLHQASSELVHLVYMTPEVQQVTTHSCTALPLPPTMAANQPSLGYQLPIYTLAPGSSNIYQCTPPHFGPFYREDVLAVEDATNIPCLMTQVGHSSATARPYGSVYGRPLYPFTSQMSATVQLPTYPTQTYPGSQPISGMQLLNATFPVTTNAYSYKSLPAGTSLKPKPQQKITDQQQCFSSMDAALIKAGLHVSSQQDLSQQSFTITPEMMAEHRKQQHYFSGGNLSDLTNLSSGQPIVHRLDYQEPQPTVLSIQQKMQELSLQDHQQILHHQAPHSLQHSGSDILQFDQEQYYSPTYVAFGFTFPRAQQELSHIYLQSFQQGENTCSNYSSSTNIVTSNASIHGYFQGHQLEHMEEVTNDGDGSSVAYRESFLAKVHEVELQQQPVIFTDTLHPVFAAPWYSQEQRSSFVDPASTEHIEQQLSINEATSRNLSVDSFHPVELQQEYKTMVLQVSSPVEVPATTELQFDLNNNYILLLDKQPELLQTVLVVSTGHEVQQQQPECDSSSQQNSNVFHQQAQHQQPLNDRVTQQNLNTQHEPIPEHQTIYKQTTQQNVENRTNSFMIPQPDSMMPQSDVFENIVQPQLNGELVNSFQDPDHPPFLSSPPPVCLLMNITQPQADQPLYTSDDDQQQREEMNQTQNEEERNEDSSNGVQSDDSQCSDVSSNVQLHSPPKKPTCHVCSVSFSSKSNLYRHVRKHSEERCQVCREAFMNKFHFKQHMKLHAGDRPFACDVCGKKYSSLKTVVRHIRIHTGEKPFSCSFCSYSSVQKCTMTAHMKTHTCEKPYVCDICKNEFSRKSYLRDHMRVHTGERPYVCDICNKSFKFKSNLSKHLLVHKGLRFFCDVCGKSFAQKNSALVHRCAHSDEVMYTCDKCEQSFSSRSSMVRHARIHLREKLYPCDICDKLFLYKSSLAKHTRKHYEFKQLKCDICKRLYKDKSSLSRHMLTTHLKQL